jgi:hypothetical protein
MAALRSLDQEVAGWQREFERRIADPYRCVLCGDQRDFCRCEFDRRENYADSGHSNDAGYET